MYAVGLLQKQRRWQLLLFYVNYLFSPICSTRSLPIVPHIRPLVVYSCICANTKFIDTMFSYSEWRWQRCILRLVHGGKYFSICSSFQFTHCVQKRKLANGKQTKTNRQNMGLQLMNMNSSLDNIQFFFHVFRVNNPISCAIMFVCVCAYAFCVLLQCVMRVFCLSGNQQGSVWLGEHLAPEATGSHDVSGWLMPMAEIRRRQ